MGAIIGFFLILLSPLFLCLFALGYIFSTLWKITLGKVTTWFWGADVPHEADAAIEQS